jgi:Protein of unknown function (DUF1385)
MARPNGVAIVSERFWAFASADGKVRTGAMPSPLGLVRRVPLLRGLMRLGASLSPLFRRTGAAGRTERAALAAAILAPVGLFFLPEPYATVAGLGLTGLVLALLLRGRALALHGAEHRAIAAAEQRLMSATWAGTVHPSRFSPRCGTNFAALALPIGVLTQMLWPLALAAWTPVAVLLVSLAVTMELWQLVQASSRRLLRALLWPGLALQRLTTREPALAETRVALAAVAAVLELQARDGVVD